MPERVENKQDKEIVKLADGYRLSHRRSQLISFDFQMATVKES